jgi:uncharacterized protein YjbI with pentapeptide repeats
MSKRPDNITRVPTLKLPSAFIRKTDLSGAILRNANLTRADASGALFRRADFLNARLDGTILKGADLTGAVNLTEEQLARAVIDDTTRLPKYIDRAKVMRLKSTSL